RITVPCESDSGAIGGESRRSLLCRQCRKWNGSQGRLLLRTLLPKPSIDNEDCKRKDRDSESACADLRPHLTPVQTAIWLDRDYGNRLNLGLQFIDEVVINVEGDRSCVRFQ